MSRVGLYWQTIRHLTLRQLVYQVLHRVRPRARLRMPGKTPDACFVAAPKPDKPVSWQQNSFTFLNQYHRFTDEIDWNYARFGKLWTYNLNYFDFLNQPGITPERRLTLIRDFMRQTNSLRDGLEPYPTSVRIINWVHFLSRNQIQDGEINRHLFGQVRLLRYRLEFHLGGNHLLENGFALLSGALYFQWKGWYRIATRLLRRELAAQILPDGGHIERSPMYHQLLLGRLLDCLLMLQNQTETGHLDPDFTQFLGEKAGQMLGWLNAITFMNGDVPMVNDAAPGIAPATAQLRQKADQAGLSDIGAGKLGNSDYRMFRSVASARFRYELFADVGAIGPYSQPGHAHADTLSFVLFVDNQPVFVDSGTSTYQPGPRRQWERGTAAHNTVTVANENSSDVWATFRVGRRARVNVLADIEKKLTARHDGYKPLGVLHERCWQLGKANIVITDQLLTTRTKNKAGQPGTARFYTHPRVPVQVSGDVVQLGAVQIAFRSETKPVICVKGCDLADGFNRLVQSHCLEVNFVSTLETTLTFTA